MELLWQAQFHLPGPAKQALCQRVLVCSPSLVLDQKPIWSHRMLTKHHFSCLQCKPHHATQHCSLKTTGKAKMEDVLPRGSDPALFGRHWEAGREQPGTWGTAGQEADRGSDQRGKQWVWTPVKRHKLLEMGAIFVVQQKELHCNFLSHWSGGMQKNVLPTHLSEWAPPGLAHLQQPFPEAGAGQAWLSCHTTWKQGQLLLLVPYPCSMPSRRA